VPSIDDLAIGDSISGEYIVTLRDGVGVAAFAAAQADGGVEILGTATAAINGFGARLSKSQLSMLASDPNVELIEENTVVGIEADQANPPSWGLDRIDQRSVNRDNNYSYNFTGAGVNAYIIDTGVRSDHREFGGRVVAGSTHVHDGRGTEDCNRHGTHVAGTVGGQTVGVAKAVTIVPIRVLFRKRQHVQRHCWCQLDDPTPRSRRSCGRQHEFGWQPQYFDESGRSQCRCGRHHHGGGSG
jgi:subtilisin family serine protease